MGRASYPQRKRLRPTPFYINTHETGGTGSPSCFSQRSDHGNYWAGSELNVERVTSTTGKCLTHLRYALRPATTHTRHKTPPSNTAQPREYKSTKIGKWMTRTAGQVSKQIIPKLTELASLFGFLERPLAIIPPKNAGAQMRHSKHQYK